MSRHKTGNSHIPSPPGSSFRQLRAPLGVIWHDISQEAPSAPASPSHTSPPASTNHFLKSSSRPSSSCSSSSVNDPSTSGNSADSAAGSGGHAEAGASASNRSSVSAASQAGDDWPFRRTLVDPDSSAAHLSYGRILSAYRHKWQQPASGTPLS